MYKNNLSHPTHRTMPKPGLYTKLSIHMVNKCSEKKSWFTRIRLSCYVILDYWFFSAFITWASYHLSKPTQPRILSSSWVASSSPLALWCMSLDIWRACTCCSAWPKVFKASFLPPDGWVWQLMCQLKISLYNLALIRAKPCISSEKSGLWIVQ